MPCEPAPLRVYAPGLLTIIREGHALPERQAEAIAGLAVAIAALSKTIASGTTPERGV